MRDKAPLSSNVIRKHKIVETMITMPVCFDTFSFESHVIFSHSVFNPDRKDFLFDFSAVKILPFP